MQEEKQFQILNRSATQKINFKNMQKIFLTITALFFAFSANAADVYKLDVNHTNIIWWASHFGFSNPSGKFTDVDGTITLEEKNLTASKVEVTIKITSLATGLPKFDNHLKSADFFDAEKYPTAKFVSTEVIPGARNTAKVKGDFTLHGVTKSITLDVKLNKIGLNEFTQKKTVGFNAKTTIKRSDFGMNYGIPGVSDNVRIEIESEANITEQKTETSSKTSDSAPNPDWKIIAKSSKLEFVAMQENSAVKGSFKKFDGVIVFDPDHLEKSNIAIDIDTTSVETSFDEGSETLKGATWLAVKTFPKATFTAKKFTYLDRLKKSFHADGTLTIKGKSLPTSLEFTLDEYSKNSAKATGKAKIKRSAFGVGDADLKKANGVKDDVEISFVISAEK
jgi:polyisoprenoid-binding protein YceI